MMPKTSNNHPDVELLVLLSQRGEIDQCTGGYTYKGPYKTFVQKLTGGNGCFRDTLHTA